MITVIHGENQAKARIFLIDRVHAAKQQQQSVITLDGTKLTEGDLETALGTASLFGSTPLIVIEHLLGGVRSKKKTALIEMIVNSPSDCIIFENKSLSAAALKQVPGASVSAFPVANSLFAWLDELGSTQPLTKKMSLLHQALEQEDEFLCFAMLARQIRLLLQVVTDTPVAMAPFALVKLKKQATRFTIPELLALHQRLYRLDLAAKQSGQPLALRQELELLTMSR